MSLNNKTVTSNLIWRLMERFGAQLVTFVVSIILARLLDPIVYGTIALVTVFTAILQVFVDSGFGSALIQKKDADDLDFSTVFYFNIVVCLILYLAIFFLAPLISIFYEKSELTLIIRVLSLTLIVSGVKNVQQAYVSKNMLFKKFFFATLGGTIGAAILGITFAYLGFGVWALVAQMLFNTTIDTIILWITVKWRPKKMFSFQRLKVLFKFGWKLLVSALLDTGYRELRSLIIGKKYSTEDLAYYNKGQQFPNLIVTNINTSIDSVLLPAMSAEQDDRQRVRTMTRRAIKTSTFIMMPLMIGLGVCAEPIVLLLLTEKWLPAVFFLRIFCFTYAFYPIHTANLNAIKAMGRSDYFLTLEVIKKVVGIATILITMWISVEAMAWSLLFTSIFSQIVNSWPNRKLLGYSFLDQLKDIFPSLFIAVLMGVGVYFIQYIPSQHYILTLLVQVTVGAVFYIVTCKIFRLESYLYVKNMVLDFIKTKIIHNNKKTNSNEGAEKEESMEECKDNSERSIHKKENDINGKTKGNRDSGLELFRIIVMILIIAHHYVVNSGLMDLVYANPLAPQSIFLSLFGAWGKIGINCFVLITGYFMCLSNITLKKFLKLLFEIMFYRVIIGIIFFATGYQEFNIIEVIKMLLPVTSVNTNFSGCYLLFFLFIPFLNILVKNMNKKQHGLLLALSLLIYTGLYAIPGISVTFNYVTWFIVLYLIGSYLRMYPFSFDNSKKAWGILSLIMILISAGSVIGCLYLGTKLDRNMAFYLVSDSNNVLAVLTGICLFMFFKNIHFHSKIINLIASTAFGVLLIHANSDAMRQWLWGDLLKNTSMFNSPYLYLHAIGFVLAIFVVCSLIDMIRIYAIEKPLFRQFDKGNLFNRG